MEGGFSFLPWVILANGLIVGAAVLARWKYRSNRYLGTFLLLLSIHGFIANIWSPVGSAVPEEVFAFMSALPFLYGPLVYLYLWHSLYRDWNGGLPLAVHALPAALNLLVYGILYLSMPRESFREVVRSVLRGSPPAYVSIIEWLKALHGLTYAILSLRLFVVHRRALLRWAENARRRLWLRSLLFSFMGVWILVLISAVFLWTGGGSPRLARMFTLLQLLAFVVFFYTDAFYALRHPSVLSPREVRERIRERLNLSEGFIRETLDRLDAAETRKFYTEPETTLTSLARRIGLHPNALSYIINETKDVSFREYLNRLRVEEFLRLARVHTEDTGQTDAARRNPGILELAFASGFSSKSTLLRAFRSVHQTTPGEYLRKAGAGFHT